MLRLTKNFVLGWVAAAAVSLGVVAPAPGDIVINEVYTGGGSGQATAAYKTDYIELFNTGLTAVDISGYRLDYGAAAQPAGNFPTIIGALPEGSSIAGRGYFLVQTGSSGTGGADDPTPDADYNSGASLSNASGGLRLQDDSVTPVTLDIFGWGSTNNFEGEPESTPASVAISLQRLLDGVDTNNNQLDFGQGAPTPEALNVPEPTSLGLLALGGLLMLRRRRA